MPVVEKNVLVAHTPAQMFHLVDDVERYPKFLPWCARGEVISRQGPELVASLHIDYLKIRPHYHQHPGKSLEQAEHFAG